jgi:spermidine synthase
MSVKRKLFIIFTFSGFSGLIYESIWTHYLKLFLGHAAYAQTLVIAIFMGGMAIGSAFATRITPEKWNVLKGYAIAEAVVGFCALAFHLIFTGVLDVAFEQLIPRIASPGAITLLKWSLGTLLILPQSILLGMTFPLMTSGILKYLPEEPGKTLSTLYFVNSIGGAVGVLASGFILIKTIGLPGTIVVAGIINLILAAIVWRIAKRLETDHKATSSGVLSNKVIQLVHDRTDFRILILIALGTGLASFIYEIGWIRMLSMVLGSSTHAFELMLGAFIIGLASGSLWIRKRIDSIKNPVNFLAIMQVVMGILAVATLPIYGKSFEAMQFLFDILKNTNPAVMYPLFNLGSHGIALMVMLPATFCAGTTLPLITHLLLSGGHGNKSIGLVYCANTIGAIVGVIAAVHIGMPFLGLKGLIIAGACLDMCLGIFLLLRYRNASHALVAVSACIAIVGAIILWVELDHLKMASGIYRNGITLDPKEYHLATHRDGKTASISMLVHKTGITSIVTNGKPDASIQMWGGKSSPDESTMVLLGAIPQMIRPEATSAAVIGFGSGLSSHVLLASKNLKVLDTIEIEPAIVEVAKGFNPRNSRVYQDSRSHIRYEDAKTFFSSQNRSYDYVVSEPSNPWVSGVSGLFTQEFYRLVSRHLKPGGLLIQWLQTYEFNDYLLASVLETISTVFSEYQIFISRENDLIIVASNSLIPSLNQSVFNNPLLAAELRHANIKSLHDVEVRRTGNKKLLAPLIQGFDSPINSDYFPYVDQNAAKARLLHTSTSLIQNFGEIPLPLQELMGIKPAYEAETSISPNFFIARVTAAYNATVFRDLLSISAPGRIVTDMPGKTTESVLEARKLLTACSQQNGKLTVMLDLAVNVVPHLQPHELEMIWKRLASWPCMSNLTKEEKGWAELVSAVGARNTSGISITAHYLLENGTRLTKESMQYLVALAMTADIAMGKKSDSKALWEKYHPILFQNKKPGNLFKILSGM